MFINYYSHGGLLLQAQFLTGFIPELVAVCKDFRCFDAVHDDTAIGFQILENFSHDFLEVTTMPANEDSIRGSDGIATNGTEITHVDIDAWSTKLSGVFLDDGFALRTNLEGFYLQMRELQTSLYRYTARTEADVPKHLSLGQIESLERE